LPQTFQFKKQIPSSQLLQHPPVPVCHLEDSVVMIFWSILIKLHRTL